VLNGRKAEHVQLLGHISRLKRIGAGAKGKKVFFKIKWKIKENFVCELCNMAKSWTNYIVTQSKITIGFFT
jgi:hypothetical protein